MKFKVNNKEVFASTGGRPFDKSKPLIIFIHGSGLSHITWVLQTRYFAFHGYSVLAIDLPGHGYSEGPALESIEEQGKWISDVIDSMDMKEASLVGHSQGCLVVLECASQFPEKIRSIGLMGGAGAIPMNPELLDLAENGDPKAVELMMDWAHGPAGHFGGHPVPGLHHMNLGGSIVINGSVKNALGVDFRACDNYKNGFEAAKKIKCPAINILGDRDRMCPVKAGKKLAENIENSEVSPLGQLNRRIPMAHRAHKNHDGKHFGYLDLYLPSRRIIFCCGRRHRRASHARCLHPKPRSGNN